MTQITWSEYQKQAHVFCTPKDAMPDHLAMGGIGIAGEAVELLELVLRAGHLAELCKKTVFHGKPLTWKQLDRYASELSDLLWYHAEICTALGLDMGDVATFNVAKLARRHGGNKSLVRGEAVSKANDLEFSEWAQEQPGGLQRMGTQVIEAHDHR